MSDGAQWRWISGNVPGSSSGGRRPSGDKRSVLPLLASRPWVQVEIPCVYVMLEGRWVSPGLLPNVKNGIIQLITGVRLGTCPTVREVFGAGVRTWHVRGSMARMLRPERNELYYIIIIIICSVRCSQSPPATLAQPAATRLHCPQPATCGAVQQPATCSAACMLAVRSAPSHHQPR